MTAIEEQSDGSFLFTYGDSYLLENGESLVDLELVYETWGELNEDKSNVILLHHALSVGSHASSHNKRNETGWWQEIVGPGKAIDTLKYFVICINNLGSCFGSSSPISIDKTTGEMFRANFPQVSITDMIRSQKILLDDLGIQHVNAIIGNSMGGMLSLSWAIEYPLSAKKIMITSSSYKSYPSNIANRHIQHQVIRMDPQWKQGNYDNNQNLTGFKLARKLGLFSYRNSVEWNRRFNSDQGDDIKGSDITDYIDYNAEKFCHSFDANSYLTLTKAMDLYDVTKDYESIDACFSRVLAKILVVSVESDILYTSQQQKELYSILKKNGADCEYINHHSKYGHDAFLVEKEAFTRHITSFLKS